MDQERTVNAILRDMKTFKVIQCDSDEAVKEYLKLIWLVGWEEGRTEVNQRFNKVIGQFNSQGKLVNIFKSRMEAARRTGYTETAIKNSMNRGSAMRKGWRWKYLTLPKGSSKKLTMKQYFEDFEKNVNGEIF